MNSANNESKKYEYEFKAGMTCTGCSGAITRILSKENGNNL